MTWWAPLAKLAIGLLRMVGRWVLERISEVGRRQILSYMREKIATFYVKRERALAAGKNLRARWYQFRIRNWVTVRDWLKDHWARITKAAARRMSSAISGLDRYVPHEDFDLWQHLPEAQQ